MSTAVTVEEQLETHQRTLQALEAEARQEEDLAAAAERRLAELATTFDRPLKTLSRERRQLEEELSERRAAAKLARQRIQSYRRQHQVDVLESAAFEQRRQRQTDAARASAQARMDAVVKEIPIRADWLRRAALSYEATRMRLNQLLGDAQLLERQGASAPTLVQLDATVKDALASARLFTVEMQRTGQLDAVLRYLPTLDEAAAGSAQLSNHDEEA